MNTRQQQRSPDDWYAYELRDLEKKSSSREVDVRECLLNRVIKEVLGYEGYQIEREVTAGKFRMDYVCRGQDSHHADVIIEVKKLGTDLYKGTKGFMSSPAGQLLKYMNGYRDSVKGTWGIVTNGTQWIVVQGKKRDKVSVSELSKPVLARTLMEVKDVLRPVRESPSVTSLYSDLGAQSKVRDWFAIVADVNSHDEFLRSVVPNAKMGGANSVLDGDGEYPTWRRPV